MKTKKHKKHKKLKKDLINHPHHYTRGSIECIEAIKASMSKKAFRGNLKGNVLKYLWRYEDKENPIQDLKKAKWYIKKLLKELS